MSGQDCDAFKLLHIPIAHARNVVACSNVNALHFFGVNNNRCR
jgi:hypothetical protein